MGEFGVPSREEEAAREMHYEEAVPRQERRVEGEALKAEQVLRALSTEQPSQEYVLAIVFVDAGYETSEVKRCLTDLQTVGEARYVPYEGWVSTVTSDDPEPMTPQAEEAFFGRRRGQQ